MKKKKDLGLFLSFLLLILGLVSVFFPFEILNGLSAFGYKIQIDKYEDLAQFISGVSSPFLTVSAFILLYLTYKSQKEELQNSSVILRQQQETLSKQQFETTFFNLLNLHNNIVSNMDLKKSSNTRQLLMGRGNTDSTPEIVTGRDCFVTFYNGYINSYKIVKKEFKLTAELDLINESYSRYFKKHQSDLGHYFKNLYHIFKFIKTSNILDKKQYSSIVRAQLSSHEMLMFFYNGLSNYGSNFKPLIKEFDLLDGLPEEDLINEDHIKLYE